MSIYRSCPYCGSNLDPGERCDCRDEQKSLTTHKKEEIINAGNHNDHLRQVQPAT